MNQNWLLLKVQNMLADFYFQIIEFSIYQNINNTDFRYQNSDNNKMQSNKNNSVQAMYRQFLEETSKEIALKISEDESIQALKEIQQKEYLLERIQEIIQIVYQSQCQNKIIKLCSEIDSLSNVLKQQNVGTSNLEHRQSRFRKQRQMTFGYTNIIPEGQESTQVVNKQLLNKKFSTNDENAIEILKNQNLQLQKQIISAEQQSQLHIKQLMESINALQRQYTSTKQKYQEKLESSMKVIKQWEEKTYKLAEDKCHLQNGLQMEIQKLTQQRLKTGNLQREIEKYQIQNQKYQKLNKSLKSQINALNDKILRLEQANQTIQRNCNVYQQQIKMIKKINQVLPSRGEQLQKGCLNSQNFQKSFQKMQVQQLKAQILQKDNKILDLEKKYFKIKSIKGQIQEQYHINKINSQKQKMEFQNESHQIIIKLQRQIRTLKQTLLNDRKTSNEIHSNKLLQLQTKYLNEKEEFQKNYEYKLKSELEKSQTFTKKIKQLQSLLKEKQIFYGQNAQQNEKKIKQLKSYTKQLQKSSSARNSSCLQLNKQSIRKQQLYDEEIRNLRLQNEKQKKQIQVKRNQIDKLKIEIKQSTKRFSKRGNQFQQKQEFKQYIQKIDQLRHNNILLSSELSHMKKELSYREEQVNQIQISRTQIEQKIILISEKLQTKQKELNKMKQNKVRTQLQYQNQTNSLHKKHQYQIQQVKKQLKQHFEDLLKDKQLKINEIKQSSNAVQYKAILSSLKETLEQQRKKSKRFQERIKQLTTSVQQYKSQIKTLNQKITQKAQKYQQLQKSIFIQKQNLKKILEHSQNKNHFYQMKFKDFKHQFYQFLREVFSEFKLSQKKIQEQVWSMKSYYQKYTQDFVLQFYEQISKLEVKHLNSNKQIRDYYEKEIILKMQIDMQQMQFTAQKKSKQKMIDLMTLLAEKQYQIKNFSQKQKLSYKRVEQLSNLYESAKIQLKDISEKHTSLKNIQEKLNVKVCFLEKQNIEKSHNLQNQIQKNMELKQQIIQNQNKYKQKMERCRQKYLQENQKLFGKYERQFDKLIGLNGKSKMTGFNSVIMSPTNIVPTKQCEKVDRSSDKKLQTLKKEILLQKKKLQGLENRNQKHKIPSKGVKNTMSLKNIVKN